MDSQHIDKIAQSQYEMGRILGMGLRDQLIEDGLFKQASASETLQDALRDRFGIDKQAMDTIPSSYAQPKNYGSAYTADPSKKEGEDAPADESTTKTEGGSDTKVKPEAGKDTSAPNGLAAGAVGAGTTASVGETGNELGSADGTGIPSAKTASANPFLAALANLG